MALSVWILADTFGYPTGGGHLFAYLNWALGLRGVGCEVVWMEESPDRPDHVTISEFARRLGAFGLERICLFTESGGNPATDNAAVVPVEEAAAADLLLNLCYEAPPELLARFRRSALLDIDPGMTQTWFADGDMELMAHDVYLTTGEGVASGTAPIPDCGVRWLYAAPCVALEFWTQAPAPDEGAYTTVAHWWSGHKGVFPDGRAFDNSKRAAFLPYLSVPASAGVDVELAVDAGELEDDAAALCNHGWLLADPVEAAGTPERYRSFIRRSRGEFSCARPAYVALATGWISDRTVCYLASARPAVVQDTGPCGLLEDAEGQGIFRFRDPEGAAAALAAVDGEHARQCSLARSLAEEKFDARRSAARLLELSLP